MSGSCAACEDSTPHVLRTAGEGDKGKAWKECTRRFKLRGPEEDVVQAQAGQRALLCSTPEDAGV